MSKVERKKVSKKDQVVAASIWRFVYESTLTKASLSLDLKKYLQHPHYRNIVYEKLIERSASDLSSPISERSLTLIKTFLPEYIPNDDTLHHLEHFCSDSLPKLTRSTDITLLAYIRNLVHKYKTTKKESIPNSPAVHAFSAPTTPHVLHSPPKDRRTGSFSIPPVLRSVSEEEIRRNRKEMAKKLVKSSLSDRSLDASKDKKVPAAVTARALRRQAQAAQLSDSSLVKNILVAKPQPKNILVTKKNSASNMDPMNTQLRKESEELYVSKHDMRTVEHINVVRKAKLAEQSNQKTLESGKRGQLTQYKFYGEQKPLQISLDQIDLVLATVLHPPEDDTQTLEMALNIVMKLFMDILAMHDRTQGQIIIAFLFELIDSESADTRIRAFNLLFNLCVHISLVDQSPLSPHEYNLRAIHESPSQIFAFHEQLFEFHKHLMLRLMFKEEKREEVWSAALNGLLYFMVNDGTINKAKLLSIDNRLIPTMMLCLENAEDHVIKLLVEMLINCLYSTDRLNTVALKHACGIDFIVEQYVKVRSEEARENLFTIIFDYLLVQLELNKLIEFTEHRSEQISNLYEVFKAVEAPHLLVSFFKYFPPNCSEKILSFLQKQFESIPNKVEKQLTVLVTEGFEKLAQSYLKLENEFDSRLKKMKEGESGDHLDCLQALIKSEFASDRKNAEIWLFELLRVQTETGLSLSNTKLQESISNLFFNLSSSTNVNDRRIYISVVEKLILLQRTNMDKNDETRITSLFLFINEHFQRVLKHEQSRGNLVSLLDSLFALITVPNSSEASSQSGLEPASYDDPYTLFLYGETAVNLVLLKHVSITVLLQLFTAISDSHECNSIRIVLLKLIVLKCENKELQETIGGISFFQRILSSKDPEIAFIAGSHILEQFESESPEQYRAILAKLLIKAQEEDDENLVSNPYLQIKAIINMSQNNDTLPISTKPHLRRRASHTKLPFG